MLYLNKISYIPTAINKSHFLTNTVIKESYLWLFETPNKPIQSPFIARIKRLDFY